MLEIVVNNAKEQNGDIEIDNATVEQVIQHKMALYDKSGEQHYDIISAFIKSMRGSDPNAALYYLARMLEGGEDPKFIARRMLILSSEDIGNANPTAFVMANNCFQATSPKSNSTTTAIGAAQAQVRASGDLPVPLHLRNAPTKLMKQLNYGKDYQYAHSFEGNFIAAEFLPDAIKGAKFYDPGHNPREKEIRRQLRDWWKEKYGY